jgi:hypothetical protein
MAFSDFTYPEVIQQLGLTERTVPDLFADIAPLQPGPALRASLPLGLRLGPAAHSEVSRAIWMVGPVLGDVWERYAGQLCLNAGVEFDGDPTAKLTGYCDFIVSRGPQRAVVGPPVLLIFEAKRDSIPGGMGQCIAGMVGARRYNLRHNAPADPIHGCVTTGSLWKFVRLNNTEVTTDITEYQIAQVDKLLGILTHIAGPVPSPVAA